MGMHVFLHTKPGVPAGSQIGYGSFVLFVDGESPDTWVLPALQRGDSPARASDAKVARALDTGLPDLPLAPFNIKCTAKGPKAISTGPPLACPAKKPVGVVAHGRGSDVIAAKRSEVHQPLDRSL